MSSITQKLTQKQQRFVDEYIISGNATQAAIKAGYSKKTAAVTATENLRKPNIKAAIEKRNEEIKSEKTADMTEVRYSKQNQLLLLRAFMKTLKCRQKIALKRRN